MAMWDYLIMLNCWGIVQISMKENTEILLQSCRDIGLEINAQKTKHMVMSRNPNSGQNQNIRIANESF
jgi:hypothetical protein